jgi:hypothetical protein
MTNNLEAIEKIVKAASITKCLGVIEHYTSRPRSGEALQNKMEVVISLWGSYAQLFEVHRLLRSIEK